jgi:hypothetical protein
MKRIMLLALLIPFGDLRAATWAQVGTGNDGNKVLVDTSSITITGSIRQAWLKMIFPPRTHKGLGDDASKWMDYNLNHAAFNCSGGTSKSDALMDYYDDGTHHEVPAADLSGDRFEAVAQGTALETVMKFVCSWKPY